MLRKCSLVVAWLAVGVALSGFSSPLETRAMLGSVLQWAWVVATMTVAAGLGLLVWRVTSRGEREKAVKPSVVEGPVADDLTRIEGIGPKISGLLRAAGITTFSQVAQADAGRLKRIVRDADLAALADPSTWPEQARLGAAGDWEALDALQDELKGGRRG